MSETKDWLESLKIGDLVVVSAGSALGLDRVDRVTAANGRHITVNRQKYRRGSGYSTAGGYSRELLVEPTPARLDAIKARELRTRLRSALSAGGLSGPGMGGGLAIVPFTLDQLTAAARALGVETP